MNKIFKPALGFDFENNITHVAIPVIVIAGKKGAVNEIHMITSDKEDWTLNEEEKESRNLYPDKLPQFALGQSRWNLDDIKVFRESELSNKEFDSYKSIFLPIKGTLESHIDFNDSQDAILITLWIIGTYIFIIFEAYPYLLLNGTRGSGKSKLLEILHYLAFNAEITSNATPASIFRIIEANLSAILIDEGEMLSGKERNRELILLLNAGYKKSGTVTRTNKDTHQVEKFQTYSPKVVAAINPLDATLSSRFITINMIKTGNKEKGNVRVSDRSANWEQLRDNLYKFALLCGFDIAEIFEKSTQINLLNCRNNELWSPLLAIAEYLDCFAPEPYIFKAVAKAAIEKTEDDEGLDDWHLALLLALQREVTTKRPYLVLHIRNAMGNFIDDVDEFNRVSFRWTANALKRFGFRRAKRTSQGTWFLLDRERVKDLLLRYEVYVDDEDSVDASREDIEEQDGQSSDTQTTQSTLIDPSLLSDSDKSWIAKQKY